MGCLDLSITLCGLSFSDREGLDWTWRKWNELFVPGLFLCCPPLLTSVIRIQKMNLTLQEFGRAVRSLGQSWISTEYWAANPYVCKQIHLLSHWNELGSYCITETLEMQCWSCPLTWFLSATVTLAVDAVQFLAWPSFQAQQKWKGVYFNQVFVVYAFILWRENYCSAFHMAFRGEAGVGSLGLIAMGKWKSKRQVKGMVSCLEWKGTLRIGHPF